MTSPQQIEQDIAETREELRADVDALKHRLTPKGAAERSAAKIGESVSNAKDRIMGTTREHIVDPAREHLSSAEEQLDRTGQAAGNVARQAKEQVRGNPLAVGLGAFAVGWLIGSVIPASRTERQAIQTVKESDAVRSAAQPLADSARGLATQAAAEASQLAKNVGETAKSEAKDVTSEAKATMSGSGSGDQGNPQGQPDYSQGQGISYQSPVDPTGGAVRAPSSQAMADWKEESPAS